MKKRKTKQTNMRERNEKRKTEKFKRIRQKENFAKLLYYSDAAVFLQSRRHTCHEKIFMIVAFVLISLSIKMHHNIDI